MKKIFLLLSVLVFSGAVRTAIAQCNFAKPNIQLSGVPYTDPVTGQCMITIDLSLDLRSNSGGKYVYAHFWKTPEYPSLDYQTPPHGTELCNSIATVAFYHHTSSLNIVDCYLHDTTIPNFQYSADFRINKKIGSTPGFDKFEIKNITLPAAAGCSVPQSFTVDVWESQASEGQVVHCYYRQLSFFGNDPKINGVINCNIPRTYSFDVSTSSPAGLVYSYKVYIDDGDGTFNPVTDTLQINEGNNLVLNASNNYRSSSGQLSYLPYSGTQPYMFKALWLVVTSPAFTNEIYYRLDNSCIILPVTLKSFTAVRSGNLVNLEWATGSEDDNSGFYIERKEGSGDWKVQGFLPSSSQKEISATELTYRFTDINNEKSNSLYRLKQLDNNGNTTVSETRMVPGIESTGKLIVFPNPARTGELNLILPELEIRADLILINMNGQIIKHWNNFSGYRLNVENITPGLYLLSVINKDTGKQQAVKIQIQ